MQRKREQYVTYFWIRIFDQDTQIIKMLTGRKDDLKKYALKSDSEWNGVFIFQMTSITLSDLTHLTRWITAGPYLLACLATWKGKKKNQQCINWRWRTFFFLMVSSQNFWAWAICQIMASICVHITFFHVTRKCNFSLKTYSLRKQNPSPSAEAFAPHS